MKDTIIFLVIAHVKFFSFLDVDIKLCCEFLIDSPEFLYAYGMRVEYRPNQ